ncbi:MAG: shikimate dehydrogenase [Chloroflexota bacterium]|nr:MAG: shikimate dehydrogenase [Chloroflexota bacterium]
MTQGNKAFVAGLIGFPLGHSISPIFQQAAFDHLGLPIRYEAWPTPPSDLAAIVRRARQPDCVGFNVTVPHKQTVMALLDTVDERARQIGAVNTVINSSGVLRGHNTDADGFIRPLRERGVEVAGCRATLIGSGGVARAAAFALAWARADPIAIAARNAAAATSLARDVTAATGVLCHAIPIGAISRDTGLLVNCTSVGMRGGPSENATLIPDDAIPEQALVYDLVYNPRLTPLLRAATHRGASALGGLPMLVYQGAAAFTLWTGRAAPIELMMSRAEAVLPA